MNSHVLPSVTDIEQYRALYKDDAVWHRAMEAICAQIGLSADSLERARHGSEVVYKVGNRAAIKLYAPLWSEGFEIERSVMEHLYGRIGVATPELVAAGELDGWPYLAMTWLDGVRIGDVWNTLGRSDQIRVAAQLGEMVGHIHSLKTDGLAPELAIDWAAFTAERLASWRVRQGKLGLPEVWLDELEEWLERETPLYPATFDPVLVTADITDDHVLLAQDSAGRWNVCGFIDFADAMIGYRNYEWPAPCVFMLRQKPEALKAFFTAYG
ncbi:MAG: aminoglycoside phosphotransferase family protein, partial [Myxococcota bacterium]